MSFADVLLKRIEEEMRNLAVGSLAAPAGRDGFEYGRVCGLYAGLDRACGLLLNLLAEEDKKDI